MGIEDVVSEHVKRAGDEMWNKIQGDIDTTDCVLVLYTINAPTSEWVTREINIAKTLGKTLIPVWEKQVELPTPLKGEEKEWIEFRRHEPIDILQEIGFNLLSRRLRTPHVYFLTEGDRYRPASIRFVVVPALGTAFHMGNHTDELVREGKIRFTCFPEVGSSLQRPFTEDMWANILGFNVVRAEPTLKELGLR